MQEIVYHKVEEISQSERDKFFKVRGYRVIDEKLENDMKISAEAIIMIEGPNGAIEHTAASGNGPVNALDNAFRKALKVFHPNVQEVTLLDYQVKVVPNGIGVAGTESTVKVDLVLTDKVWRWETSGKSNSVIEASFLALTDGYWFKLHKDLET